MKPGALFPPSHHYINLTCEELDAPIHRFMPIKYLVEMAKTKKNILVRPSEWDDPFENFLLKAFVRHTNGEVISFGFRNDIYGQCWTRGFESDAMWRIYSHDKNGVRVRTTPRRLLLSLWSSRNKFSEISCFIGKVEYRRTKEILKALKDPDFVSGLALSQTGRGQCESLLIKRPAFKHENEVRLLFFQPSNERSNEKHFVYHFDPIEHFDQIFLDPRLEPSEAMSRTDQLLKLGFKCQIKRSNLYAPREFYAVLS